MVLPTKNQILAATDSLCYTKRFNYASQIGRDHKDDPGLKALVNDLLKHPDPPVPELDVDDGFTEVLPPQRTSIAKYYNEDQIALAIAVAAGMFDIIKAHVTSPSSFFDNLVFSNYIRMQVPRKLGDKGAPIYCAADEEVVASILTAVPARRSLLIKESIQAKRLNIVELVIPQLLTIPGTSSNDIAHLVHACSSSTLKSYFQNNRDKLHSIGVKWSKITKFHAKVVLELMNEDFQARGPFDRAVVWNAWRVTLATYGGKKSSYKPLLNLFENRHAVEGLLDFLEKYPQITYTGTGTPVVEPGSISTEVPGLLTDDIYLVKNKQQRTCLLLAMIKLFPERFLRVACSIDLTKAPYFSGSIFYPGVSYKIQNDYFKHILEKYDVDQCCSIFPQIYFSQAQWNTHQTVKVAKVLYEYAMKHIERKGPAVSHLIFQFYCSFMTTISNKLDRVYTQVTVKPKESKEYLAKQIAKYRTALTYFVEIFNDPPIKHFTVPLPDQPGKTTVNNYLHGVAPHALLTAYAKDPAVVLQFLERTASVESVDVVYQNIYKPLVQNLVQARGRAFTEYEVEFANSAIRKTFEQIRQKFPNLNTFEKAELLKHDSNLGYHFFVSECLEAPLEHMSFLVSVFHLLSPEKKLAVYKSHNLSQLSQLAQINPDSLIKYMSDIPLEEVTQGIAHILQTPNSVDENTRNRLVSFQDIKDMKVRKALQTMANSSNTAERTGAIQSIVEATVRTKDLNELLKTLQFVRDKIKNESAPVRFEVLNTMFSVVNLITSGYGTAHYSVWNDILSDVLEAHDQSLTSQNTAHFKTLSRKALEIACSDIFNHDKEMFDFAVDVAWRICVFEKGQKEAAASFELPNITSSFLINEKPVEKIGKLISLYSEVYEKLLASKNPTWKDSFKYYLQFFSALAYAWEGVPELVEQVRHQVSLVKSTVEKDGDGLYVVGTEDPLSSIVDVIISVIPDFWGQPSIDVIEVAMRSRLASKVLRHWVQWKEMNAKTAKQIKECRDQYVTELLQISPSAIHLRFVWRHIVTYMQHKLDDYIGKKKSFRGVFYVEPEARKFVLSCRKAPPAKKGPTGKRKKQRKERIKIANATAPPNAKLQLEGERAKEAKLKEEIAVMEGNQIFHEDFYYLEACYGLQRLLPRQLHVVANDWATQLLSADIAVPVRVKATARWTIMPTVTYADIVAFLNENEHPTDNKKPMVVNIVEALLRGVTRNDEKTAPLSLLLSPRFLGSDRSRVSVYAISSCLPYLPHNGLSQIIKLCFSGKARHSLKISSYKEIIRLLAKSPTKDNTDMIFREWKRPDLHRDIRIEIVKNAIRFLASSIESLVELGWQILNDAATRLAESELLLTLVCVLNEKCPAFNFQTTFGTSLENSRVLEHLVDMTTIIVQTKHIEKYAIDVIAKIATTAESPDVKYLATAMLTHWTTQESTTDVLFKYLQDVSPTSLLYSSIQTENQIFITRATYLVNRFITVCESLENGVVKIKELGNLICDQILKLSNAERQIRKRLVHFVVYVISNTQRTNFEIYDALVDLIMSRLPEFTTYILYVKAAALTLKRYRVTSDIASKEAYTILDNHTAVSALYPSEHSQYSNILFNLSPAGGTINFPAFVAAHDDTASPTSTSQIYLYFIKKFGQPRIEQSDPHEMLKLWEDIFALATEVDEKSLREEPDFKSTFFTYAQTHLMENFAKDYTNKLNIHPNAKTIISTIAQRFLEALEGKTDPFAKELGHFLFSNNGCLFAEATPAEVWYKIAHLLLSMDEDADATFLRYNPPSDYLSTRSLLLCAFGVDDAINSFLTALLTLELDTSQKEHSENYVKQVRHFGVNTLLHISSYVGKNFEIIDKFIDTVVLTAPDVDENIDDWVDNLAKLIEVATTQEQPTDYAELSPSGVYFLTKYLDEYLKIGNGGASARQKLARKVLAYFLLNKGLYIIDNLADKVPLIVKNLLLDAAATEGVVTASHAFETFEDLSYTIKKATNVSLAGKLCSEILHQHLVNSKNQRYVEACYEFLWTLYFTCPQLVLHSPIEAYYYLNWVISMYMEDPETNDEMERLKYMLTEDHRILSTQPQNVTADEISRLVEFINTIVELRHQEFILPQQTWLPSKSFKQYSHISHVLALAMVTKYGDYLKITADNQYTWRQEFIDLLDKLGEVDDALVQRTAWEVEIVSPIIEPEQPVVVVPTTTTTVDDDLGFGLFD